VLWLFFARKSPAPLAVASPLPRMETGRNTLRERNFAPSKIL
jgi:hypothetical protein